MRFLLLLLALLSAVPPKVALYELHFATEFIWFGPGALIDTLSGVMVTLLASGASMLTCLFLASR